MLDGIRKAANNWLGRIVLTVIMGVLILSFAAWGIGDMLRVNVGTSVASVGKTEIQAETFRRTYNSELESLSKQLRRRVTNEEARAYGLDRQVLARMISNSALDQEAAKLHLNLSTDDVVTMITKDTAFKGAGGAFDRNLFFDYLRNNQMSEAQYIDEQRRMMLRRQIGIGISGDIGISGAMLNATSRFVSEQRTASYFVLPVAAAGEIGAPDEAALKTFFDSRKNDFRAPEYRKVSIISALPSELGVDITVTDEDIRRIYDRRLATGQYGVPEKRHVQQILFPNDADAKAAADKITAGATFESIIEERKLKPEDTDLGTKTQRELSDPAVANIAFTALPGSVSAPVKGQFGTALVRVLEIIPGTLTPFEDVKAELQPEAMTEKQRRDQKLLSKLDDMQKKIDDGKTAGKSLAEIASANGLKLRTIDALDATGKDKAGNRVDLPGSAELLKAIFQSDIGLDNDALRLKEGGLVWFEINGVDSARERGLDEVKTDLIARWRIEEIGKRLSEKATALVKRIDAGEDIAILAREAGTTALEAAGVTRQAPGPIGQTAAARIFGTPVGKALAVAQPDGSRMLLKVTAASATQLDPASGVAATIRKQIGEQVSEDIASQYIQKVQSELGTSINAKVLAQALGSGN